MNIRQYWKALNAFDWDYEYTEDAGLRKRRLGELKELNGIAAMSEKHQSLFDGFLAVKSLHLKLTLPSCPPLLTWNRELNTRVHRVEHFAHYTNEAGFKSIFRLKRRRGNLVLLLNGEEVTRLPDNRSCLEVLKQTAEDML